ncbi:hypothetical protein Lal_00024307 [Lupinus albus]|nr:hypothetical protein Lal_00024307 [Lupinus albus]
MIPKIKDKLRMRNLLRDWSLLHMCCCAHILNLIVKDGLEVVKDGIENIRDNCPTRWNSTYKVLEVAILYKDVFRDTQYTCLPSNSQWQFADDLAISQWMNSSNEFIKRMEENMMTKFEKYWSVIHDITGVAIVLDPRYKMTLIELYFDKLDDHDACTQVSKIREFPLLINRTVANDKTLDEYDVFIERRRETRSSSVKTKLDHYLEEHVIKRTPDFVVFQSLIPAVFQSLIPASLLAQIIWGSSVTL